MSEIKKNRCECCDKETEDWYAEPEWIQFAGASSTVVRGKRRPDRSADVKCFNLSPDIGGHALDFCGPVCLMTYLDPEADVTKTASRVKTPGTRICDHCGSTVVVDSGWVTRHPCGGGRGGAGDLP